MNNEWQQYRKKHLAELRPITIEEESYSATKLRSRGISVSPADIENCSPRRGDMIVRNPDNHTDMWLVAKRYFDDNFEEVEQSSTAIADNLLKIEEQRYTFVTENGKSVLMQRMNKDMLWYAVYANQIIDWNRYRHDLEQQCNLLLS